MDTAATYEIRMATPADSAYLRTLAVLDSQTPVEGPALVGSVDGVATAVVSLTSGRTVAHPFRPTASVRERVRGALPAVRRPAPRAV